MTRIRGIIGGIAPESTIDLISALKKREGVDGVILAGTELRLLLRGAEVEGVEMLDTTALHVSAIVDRLFA